MPQHLKKYHASTEGKNLKRRLLLSACFYFFSVTACLPAAFPANSAHVRAIKSAAVRDYDAAAKTAKESADPKLIKLIEWFRLTDTAQVPDFASAQSFMKKNPDWPRVYLIRRNAELALLKSGKKAALEKWFKVHPPVSPKAVLAYADILMERKEWEKAVPMLHALWTKADLNDEEADLVREKLFFLLDEHDYSGRVEKLLNERKASAAKRLIPMAEPAFQPLAQARADLISNAKNAQKDLKKLPESRRHDEGLTYDLLRWLRVNRKFSAAAKLLENIAPEKQKSARWWTEKSALIRQFIGEKEYLTAYNIAKNHHMTKGADFADAEWTAGWIALRNLKKRPEAVAHFQNMLRAVSSPLSVARAEYWLGRALEESGKPEKARPYYEKAADKITTIYGQLAAEKTGRITPMPTQSVPDTALIEKFKKSELFAIMKMLESAEQHDLVALFATRLFLDAQTPQAVTALAYALADGLKRDDLAVTIARRARQSGTDIVFLGYPVRDLKHDERTESAIILSIIRQESSFASHAVSPAGARGLMQIMPATAKQMAHKKRKAFSVQKLNADPDFNVELGSTYFAELLKRFDGSYILAVAAYNAGPTNVKKWLNTIGNPLKDVDPVDWIERIPFGETRNYVQRVLENLHVYRRHLNYPESSLNVWKKND